MAELDKKIDSCIACRRSFSQDAITRETHIGMFHPSLYGDVCLFCIAAMVLTSC